MCMPAPEMGVVASAGRMPSMVAEPKTLTLEQLKFAREAALYVVSTKTTEEAIRIFTEGLKPVRGVTNQLMSSDDDDDSSSDSDDSDDSMTKRDIATAPF